MRKTRILYKIKLYLIITLAVLFFGSIEIMVEQPLLFSICGFAIIKCVRSLWRSALQDERSFQHTCCLKLPKQNNVNKAGGQNRAA